MTRALHDLLHRVADEATPANVPDDLWARARRSRRRERAAAYATAAALVLGAVAVGVQPGWLPGPGSDAPPAAGPQRVGGAAVPDRVHAVPERLEARDSSGAWSHPREEVSVVRRASVGYVSNGGGAVLVSARDGVHHRVALPGFNDPFAGFEGEGPVLAVSPDGRRVAYAWRKRMPRAGERVPSGLRVLDLASGSWSEHRLPGGHGVRARALGWSPSGRYLVYRVGVMTRVDAGGGFTVGRYRLERLDLDEGARVVVPRFGRLAGGVAVSDDGTVALAAGSTLLTWSPTREPQVREQDLPADLSGASAWSPDGRRVALGSVGPVDGVTVARPAEDTTDSQGGAGPAALSVQVLGWVGRHHVLAVRHRSDAWTEATLDLLPVDTGEERTVGVVDGGVPLESLTVATGLMSLRHPTAELGDPGWPADLTRRWWVGAGALLLAATGLTLVVRRRRD